MKQETLYIVVPCYNETEVLPATTERLVQLVDNLVRDEQVPGDSRILYVDDGSADGTWTLIEQLAQRHERVCGVKLAGNVGHQNALMAGLETAIEAADLMVTIDADLQDDINVIPESLGVSKNALKDVIVVPFNDIENTRRVLAENADEVACVIIEPVMGSAGQITPDPEWLQALRQMTTEYNVLLIFDEVVTGRLSTGGAHKHYGIMPDLISLGKIIGGGIPVGAFGGRRDIMDIYDPRRHQMYHSGTFNGNAITMAAGYATMKAYDAEKVDYVNALGARFRDGILEIYRDLSINMQISGVGSIYNTLFTNKVVRNYRDVATAHEELNKILFVDLITRGVFNAERGMFAMNTAMTEGDVDFCLDAVRASLKDMLPIIAIEAPELV